MSSAVHVHEVEEAFVTPRVSTDGGLLPADGAALRARVFPSPWCSVCCVELMSAGVLRQLIFVARSSCIQGSRLVRGDVGGWTLGTYVALLVRELG